jgi:hypothetical protein
VNRVGGRAGSGEGESVQGEDINKFHVKKGSGIQHAAPCTRACDWQNLLPVDFLIDRSRRNRKICEKLISASAAVCLNVKSSESDEEENVSRQVASTMRNKNNSQ